MFRFRSKLITIITVYIILFDPNLTYFRDYAFYMSMTVILIITICVDTELIWLFWWARIGGCSGNLMLPSKKHFVSYPTETVISRNKTYDPTILLRRTISKQNL